MKNAQVRLYCKGDVVFLRGEIGVVSMGSVEIRRHNNRNLLKPYIVKKAVEGDIIGYKDGDDNYSSSPLSWMTAMQNDTEVIFFNAEDFSELWGIQRKFTEQ